MFERLRLVNVRIELLGRFRVTVGTRVIPDDAWQRKPAAVVKLLALAPGHRLHRERLIDLLWPGLEPAAAAANLRKAVHRARRVLGAPVIVSRAELLALPADGMWIDIDELVGAVAAARRSKDAGEYERALALWGGDLLPDDLYETWAIERRRELHDELLSALEETAGILEASGDIDGAIRIVSRVVADEPLREHGHLWLIRLHALAGRRAEALREYERFRELLARELGTEPSAEAQRLHEEVRANQTSDPELTAALWERVGDLRVLSGDPAGAAKAFASALRSGDQAELGRLHRKLAAARLLSHDAGRAELHLAAAENLTTEPAERARLACLRANQAWERGDLDAAQGFADHALELAVAAAVD